MSSALERPHVAGNSLGGWIALELAKRGPRPHRRPACRRPASRAARSRASPAALAVAGSVARARACSAAVRRALAGLTPGAVKLAFGQWPRIPSGSRPRTLPRPARAGRRARGSTTTLSARHQRAVQRRRADRRAGHDRVGRAATGCCSRARPPRAARRSRAPDGHARPGCGHVPIYDDPSGGAGAARRRARLRRCGLRLARDLATPRRRGAGGADRRRHQPGGAEHQHEGEALDDSDDRVAGSGSPNTMIPPTIPATLAAVPVIAITGTASPSCRPLAEA